MEDKPTDPLTFREKLPQYEKTLDNILPVIYGILRRAIWLMQLFKLFGQKP